MDDPQEKRTYSPLVLLALFLLLGIGGLVVGLLNGSRNVTPTEPVDTEDAVVPSTTAATPSTVAVPVTFPDGTAAPERLAEVVVEPGQVTYVYRLPPEMGGDETARLVAPTTVEVVGEGSALAVSIGCVVSAGAVPDELVVVEDPLEVEVTAVVIGERLGRPCPAGEVVEQITVPLGSRVGERRVVIAPAGSRVPG